jgi:hypothetical protein
LILPGAMAIYFNRGAQSVSFGIHQFALKLAGLT